MPSSGYAMYDAAGNRLEVIHPGENTKRYIRCTNISLITTAMSIAVITSSSG